MNRLLVFVVFLSMSVLLFANCSSSTKKAGEKLTNPVGTKQTRAESATAVSNKSDSGKIEQKVKKTDVIQNNSNISKDFNEKLKINEPLVNGIKNALNVGNNEEIWNNRERLKYLSLNDKSIGTDISILRYFTKLTCLNLSNNELTEINIPTELTALEYLYLSGNKLTKISIPIEFPALKVLNLSGNKLTEISIQLAALKYLNLSRNNFSEEVEKELKNRFPDVIL